MPVFRVCLEPALNHDNYGPAYNMSIDMILDDQGNPLPRMTFLGVMGGLAPNADGICPFVLFADGTGDFGDGFDAPYRDFTFNIVGPDAVVQPNEFFTYVGVGEDGEEIIVYRVVQMIPL